MPQGNDFINITMYATINLFDTISWAANNSLDNEKPHHEVVYGSSINCFRPYQVSSWSADLKKKNLHVKALLEELVYTILWLNYNVTDVVNVVMLYLVIISTPQMNFLLEIIKIYWTGLNLIELKCAKRWTAQVLLSIVIWTLDQDQGHWRWYKMDGIHSRNDKIWLNWLE